jgi:hypothetical protein
LIRAREAGLARGARETRLSCRLRKNAFAAGIAYALRSAQRAIQNKNGRVIDPAVQKSHRAFCRS